MLDHVAEGIEPVVVDLAAQNVAADAPLRMPAGGREVRVAGHQIVEVGNLERGMVELGLADPEQEQRVVIDELLAAIAAQKRTERRGLVERDLVGGDQAEVLLVPSFARPIVEHVEHAMAQPLDVRRPCVQPQRAPLCAGWSSASLRTGLAGTGSTPTDARPATTSTWKPFGSVARTTRPPPGPANSNTSENSSCRGQLVEVGDRSCFERETDEARLVGAGE